MLTLALSSVVAADLYYLPLLAYYIAHPMSESNPPPIYSKEDPDQGASSQTRIPEPQVLIIPTGDSMNFQKGFLGAEGERATVEGELQLKGFAPEYWQKM